MKRKQYILFGNYDYDFCIIDIVNKLHTDYFDSIKDVLSNPINKNYYINKEGRIKSMLNNKKLYSFDQIILESDIPITAENYPELLI
ncbi:MAG: hypothetical protein PVF17_04495 [Ignavibacteria bacterium]|jgi:hypothetical protein